VPARSPNNGFSLDALNVCPQFRELLGELLPVLLVRFEVLRILFQPAVLQSQSFRLTEQPTVFLNQRFAHGRSPVPV
jgi:hypothetical protein